MPLHRPRSLHVLLGAALVVGLVATPGVSLGARPIAATQTYVVLLRRPDGPSLPSRRGGLRTGATAIARARALATSRAIDALELQVGFQAGSRYTYAVDGFAARLTAAQAAALGRDRRVLDIRPDRRVELASGSQVTPTSITRIKADPSTAPAQTVDVSVAVVDTGVGFFDGGQWRHAGELNVVGGVNAYDPLGGDCANRVASSPTVYDDTNGHGTHVAGTIGAADNGIGVVGVAPGAMLYSVRVFQGVAGTDATVICGLDWIAAWNMNHASETDDIDAVNMSLRGFEPPNGNAGCDTAGNTDAEELAICAVVATGASVVVAAGNESDPVANYIPSRYESVITVSAMSDFDGLPGGLGSETCVPPRGPETDDTFSQYSNFGPEVDVIAPGTCIRSTALASANGISQMSGTSMATPHVTGAIARYLSTHPNTTPAAMHARLVDAASLDWDASSDRDTGPDRLVDVAALLSEGPDLAVYTVPQVIGVPGGTSEIVLKVSIQRIGGYAGAVTLATEALPDGVASATFVPGDPIPSDGLVETLTLTMGASPPDGERQLVIHATGEASGPGDQATVTLRFDATPPEFGTPSPRAVLRTGPWMDHAPVRLSWSATDAQGPLAKQEVQRSLGGGDYSTIARPNVHATSSDTTIDRSADVAWRIRATDAVGNVATSAPLITRLGAHQSGAAVLSAGWRARSRSTASNRDLITTTGSGGTATLDFTGRSVAVVAPVSAGLGRFRVSIDGATVGTVDLAAGAVGPRRIVFASDALAPGPHTLRIVSLRGKVELDAFLVLR